MCGAETAFATTRTVALVTRGEIMAIFRILLTILLLVVLASCAGHSTRSNPGRELAQGEYETAFRHAEYSIVHGNDKAEDYIRLFKERYPESKPSIAAYYRNNIENSTVKLELLAIPENMAVVHKAGLLSDADYQSFTQLLAITAARRIRDGSLPLVLTDDYQTISFLTTPPNEEVIFRNSVDKLVSTGSRPLAETVFKVAAEKGPYSPEYQHLMDHITQIRLPKEMLDGDFKELFPDEAQARAQRTRVKLKLVASSKDDDDYLYGIEEFLQQNEQVDLVDEINPDTYVVTLRKLRFRERELPERTQSIRYARHEVNLAGAVLLMPQNATYLYDVSTGGFSISYLFNVKLTQGGKELLQEKIQGKQEEKYSFCTDARIRNVFGGVSSASFVANPDMQSRCSDNTHSVDEDAAYNKVLQRIATQILSLPPISNRLHYGML
jgi:hypothetical protein